MGRKREQGRSGPAVSYDDLAGLQHAESADSRARERYVELRDRFLSEMRKLRDRPTSNTAAQVVRTFDNDPDVVAEATELWRQCLAARAAFMSESS